MDTPLVPKLDSKSGAEFTVNWAEICDTTGDEVVDGVMATLYWTHWSFKLSLSAVGIWAPLQVIVPLASVQLVSGKSVHGALVTRALVEAVRYERVVEAKDGIG